METGNNTITNTGSGSFIDSELINFLGNCIGKVNIFVEMDLKASSDLEEFLSDFIKNYALRFKQIQVIRIIK